MMQRKNVSFDLQSGLDATFGLLQKYQCSNIHSLGASVRRLARLALPVSLNVSGCGGKGEFAPPFSQQKAAGDPSLRGAG